ncbi:DUF58 domain-containing protein [Clostridium cellulovorans]|uniref:Uncharacterized protein n=1 Tax=Clostridium cellulovorans (strain ATCC 35296 / DSM 3052 / OCM 3 / 743B) TaxID=573061 RepID=D9SQ40_CLOC7|nr:DUF58 domain-containing protein [Clostridium cellulovorans]ADL52176.1 protein of unknown function DUF58 [Clostridium cellulovorans 743B]
MRIIVIVLIVFLVYSLQSNFYCRWAFKNLFVTVKFKDKGVFNGEFSEIVETVTNKKLLPLWWLSIAYTVSGSLRFRDEEINIIPKENYRKNLVFLKSYEKVTNRYGFSAEKRGYYRIDELNMSTSDVFSKYHLIAKAQNETEFYVYPKLLSKEEFQINFNSISGEALTKRHLIEDPFFVKCIRNYEPFDSLKKVNWYATAKTGDLRVNEYDYTATQKVTIFLNCKKRLEWDDDELIEASITLVASLISDYGKNGVEVELRTNGTDIISNKLLEKITIGNVSSLTSLYESLARIDIDRSEISIDNLLRTYREAGKHNEIIIIISYSSTKEIIEEYNLMQAGDNQVTFIMPQKNTNRVEEPIDRRILLWEVNNYD